MKIIKMRLLFVVMFASAISAGAQELKHLTFAPPKGSGMSFGYLYVDEYTSIIIGLNTIYLINKQGFFVDTLNLADRNEDSFLDYVNHINIINTKTKEIGISTLRKAIVLRCEDDRFLIEKELVYKEVPFLRGFDMVVFGDNILVGRKSGKIIRHSIFYLEDLNSNSKKKLREFEIKPISSQSSYKHGQVLSYSNYQFFRENIFIYYRNRNEVYIINSLSNKQEVFALPTIDTKSETNLFYIDSFTGNIYLHHVTSDNVNKLFLFISAKNEWKLVKEVNFIIRGIYNRQMYVSDKFDGVSGHFLIPIYTEKEEINLLDTIEVNEKVN